jgi:signal transduction histidine kinase
MDLLEPFIPEDGQLLRTGLDRLRSLTKRTLDNVRALSHDLRPTILDDFGLVAALRWYVDEYEQTFGVPVEVEVDKPPERLAPEVELALFRIAQEALTNSGKYAEASSVRLALSFPDSSARLVVEDDGRGFDPEKVIGPTKQGGLGLYGMRERADLLGATLTIHSTPGAGTHVMVDVPLSYTEGGAMSPASGVLAGNRQT